ncbi:disease resistance protein RGA5-like [Triticum aestivum]|uniref:disease resistance protein RGA5-like n=1 Tax=Triticum aestivum TaxID=4565 RepID=UPI001D004DA5|nr:disease resistance protein RGA5-like [Triticum aestivum]
MKGYLLISTVDVFRRGCIEEEVVHENLLFLLKDTESALLVVANFSHSRYKHLMLAEGTSSIYTAEVDAGDHNTPLIGIQGAVRKLLRWSSAYREDSGDRNIISIVGPAGAGKTALAMEVYHQLQTGSGEGYFQCCATAKVPSMRDVPDIWKFLVHILSQIDESAAQSGTQFTGSLDELDQLGLKIKQRLRDKRYLIVLDDLWAKPVWDVMNDIFPRSTYSQIIITTRIPDTAYSISSNVHEVQPLNNLHSERLLLRKAGLENGYLPDNLKQSCNEILRRCEGIPFFLSGNAEWASEQQQEVQKISSICSLEKAPQLVKKSEELFSPSYDSLSYGSKLLLLYMSMFPHGHIFDKDSLIRKCVAQGLVDYSGDGPLASDLVRLAEKNIVELCILNVIKSADCKLTAQVEMKQWQVNYFMLQFLASKAADKGLACTSSTIASVAPAAGEGKKVQWLYLHRPDAELPTQLRNFDLSHCRSLLVSGAASEIPFDKLIHLAVLDLEGWQCFKDMQQNVGTSVSEPEEHRSLSAPSRDQKFE